MNPRRDKTTATALLLLGAGLLTFCAIQALRAVNTAPSIDPTPKSAVASVSERRESASDVLAPVLERPSTRAPIEAPRALVSTPPAPKEPYYPPKDPIAFIANDIRHDIEKLRELKLAGTAERIVSRSTYLREDLLGRSYLDPVPPEVLKNVKTFSTLTGPNGARTYVFTPEEYPLYTEMKQRVMNGEPYEAKLDDAFVEKVIAYAEDTLTWVPAPK
jgi:hypothetical protein